MAKGHKQRSPREGKAPEGFLAKGHIQHSQGHRPWNAAAREHVWPSGHIQSIRETSVARIDSTIRVRLRLGTIRPVLNLLRRKD